jgi:hypothetical protein
MKIDILEPITLKSNTNEFDNIIHNSRSNIINELIEPSRIEKISERFSNDIKCELNE